MAVFSMRSTVLAAAYLSIWLSDAPFGFAQPTERSAWTFRMQGKDVAYVRCSNGDWLFAHPDKALAELAEIESTETEVLLQNKRTKLFVKLTDERSYWRRPKDEKWTDYARGKWSPPPQTVLDWIKQEQSSMEPDEKAGSIDRSASTDDYEVRVVYFVPMDREPTSNWEAKIRTVVHFVDSLYANDLRMKGHSTDGLAWQKDNDQVRVHLVRGRRPANFYNDSPKFDNQEQFRRVNQELPDHDFGRGQLRLVFCETYDLGPADKLWNGVFALGAYDNARGGLAMYSSHILRDEFCATSPEEQAKRFFDQTPVVGRRALGHRMNSARCEFAEDGFGAVIHELGHALGLPHDFRDQDRYIMSNGFRQIRRNLSSRTRKSKLVTFSDINTLLLMSTRFLNPDVDRTDDTPPEIKMEVLDIDRKTARVRLKIEASDNVGLRAFAVLDQNAEAFVAGDEITDREFARDLVVRGKPEKSELRLTLIVADEGGNQSRQEEVIK